MGGQGIRESILCEAAIPEQKQVGREKAEEGGERALRRSFVLMTVR